VAKPAIALRVANGGINLCDNYLDWHRRACNIEPYSYLLHVFTEMPQRLIDADISD
jgi:hypothetical protein